MGLDLILPLFLTFAIVLVVVLMLVGAGMWVVSRVSGAVRPPSGRHRPPQAERKL